MAYFFYCRYKKFITDYGQGDEEVERYEDMHHHCTVLSFLFGEEIPGEIINGRWSTIKS